MESLVRVYLGFSWPALFFIEDTFLWNPKAGLAGFVHVVKTVLSKTS